MYGKAFASMYTGSMVGAGPTVFAVWGYVIANTVKSRIEINPTLLAAILGTTPADVQAALDKLQAPDPDSRSGAHDGRRLLKEGAFLYFVPTHEHYRKIATEDDRREYLRVKQAERRSRQHPSTPVNSRQQPSTMSTHTEADPEADPEIPTPVVPAPSGSGIAPAPASAPTPAPKRKRAPRPESRPADNHDLVMTALGYWREKWPHHRVTPGPGELAYTRTSEWVEKRGLDFVQAVVRGSVADDWQDRRKHATMDVLLRDDNRDRFAAMDPDNPTPAPSASTTPKPVNGHDAGETTAWHELVAALGDYTFAPNDERDLLRALPPRSAAAVKACGGGDGLKRLMVGNGYDQRQARERFVEAWRAGG